MMEVDEDQTVNKKQEKKRRSVQPETDQKVVLDQKKKKRKSIEADDGSLNQTKKRKSSEADDGTKRKDSEADDGTKRKDSEADDGKKTENKNHSSNDSYKKKSFKSFGKKKRENTVQHEIQLEVNKFKDRKKIRKMQSKTYQTSTKAKELWEELRKFDLKPSKRQEITLELMKLIKGQACALVFAHDTSRVVQSLIKYGNMEQKDQIFDEIKARTLEMAKSKYAKFCVRKILKYGSKEQREFVFGKLYGHIKKLIRHKEASEVIECAYNDFANATQRAAMIEEFYGPAYQLHKTPEDKNLAAFLKKHPDMEESIMLHLKEKLSSLVEKNVLLHSFVHKLFFDFFSHANKSLRTEMIETVREGLVHMLHTREGSRVAMMCLWHGTAKDRKVIVKSFKTYVSKICKDEFGHLVMLALFDVLDDTKLVQKAILEELLQSVSELAKDGFGRKVLFYLLCPRDPLNFHPDVVAILQQGDKNEHSKKEAGLRRHELLTFVSQPLVKWVAQNVQEITTDNALLLLMLTVFKHVTSDPTTAMKAVAEIASAPFTGSGQGFNFIDHPGGHNIFKRLILNDAERKNKGEKILFSTILLDVLPEGRLKSWTSCNRGCFVVVSLLETGDEEIVERVKKQLADMKASLKKQTFKGAQILLNKL